MANKDDYLKDYRSFFETFAHNYNPHDQLPVKLGSYKLVNSEVVGAIVDWTTQYLSQKKCPQPLLSPLIKIIVDEVRSLCKKQTVMCGFSPPDNAYEPLRFMHTVMSKTNEICLRYLDNSKLCSLPAPGPPYNVVTACAIKNSRRRMEDRHVIIHDLNTLFINQEVSPSSYYAIFDGHAGDDAAAYSSAHLHQFLAESKHFISNPETALREAFLKTDTLFNDKCNVDNVHSGTTAICALLKQKEKTLYIAWVGDSQAALVRQGECIQCVQPHKPCREDERARIEELGGAVILWGTWRVNGQLAVSRAIGDLDYKPYVTAVPDIIEVPLTGAEDFLILACDGLWDVVSEQEAARCVYQDLANNQDDIEAISQHLVEVAKEQGSCDNITVIVVFLREPSKVAAEAHWATRHTIIMDTLDNANATNPFVNSNNPDILNQKDNFVFNLAESCKQNGTENVTDFLERSANGKRSVDEFDEDDDLGPETDVDTIDEISMSPTPLSSRDVVGEFVNNNPIDPFYDNKEEKATLETDSQKRVNDGVNVIEALREETPTPPADSVQDTSGLVDNVAESGDESEDEWNYFKGDQAEKENINSLQSDKKVFDLALDLGSDTMSQLNPNAAEFVPISPKRETSSPIYQTLVDDLVIAQSPRRITNNGLDINVPNPQEFETEIKLRPSDVKECANEDETDNVRNLSSQEIMENLLNGKTIEEIEFQPTNTPVQKASEFHFGPNSTPFSTPGKLMDQSTALSTKAVFGDESNYLNDSFNDEVQVLDKEEDCMSMSFYEDKEEQNPDLNKVQMLPENVDEFLNKSKEEVEAFIKEDPVCNLPLTEVVPNEPSIRPACKLPFEEDIVCNEPIQDLVCNLPLEDPVCSLPVKDQICDLPVTDPVCNLPVGDSVCELRVDEPVCNLYSEDPVCELPVEHPVCELRANELIDPICSVPVQEPVHETVISHEPDNMELLEPKSQDIDEIERLSPLKENLSTSSANLGSQSSLPELQSPVPEGREFSDEFEIDVRSSLPEPDLHLPEMEQRPLSSDTKSPVPEDVRPQVQSPTGDKQSPELIEDLVVVKEPEIQADLHVDTTSAMETVDPLILDLHPLTSAEPVLTDTPLSPKEKSSPICSPIQKTEPTLLDEVLTVQSTKELPVETAIDTLLESPKPPIDLPLSSTKSPSPNIQSPLSPTKSPLPQSVSPAAYPITHEIDSPIEDVTSSVKDSPLPLASPTEQIIACPISESSEVIHQPDLLAEITSPKSVIDTESIATTDVNSFLERSLVPDMASPLSGDEIHITGVCNTGLENLDMLIGDVEIKSEIIQPEFPIQTVTTPSQESKSEETPCIQLTVTETIPEIERIVAIPITEKVVAEKVKPASSPVTAKKVPSKASSTTKPPIKASTTKVTTMRTSTTTTKPPQTKTSTSTVNKAPLASKTTTPKDSKTMLKTTEKKPVANGEVKPLVKKTTTTTTAPRSIPNKTTTPKSPTKPPATKTTPLSTTRPIPQAASKVNATKVTGPKQSPVPPKSTVAKSTPPVTKTSSTLPPKPKTTTVPPLKRQLASKPTPKAPDTEKQIKETTNKQLTSSTRLSSPRKPPTTVKAKPSSSTLTKASSDVKKPQELIRHSSAPKTKPTAIKKTKPVANGDATKDVTELTKDVSPVIENNIVDNSQILDVNNTD